LRADTINRTLEADFVGPDSAFQKTYTDLHRMGFCLASDEIKLCKISYSSQAELEVSLLSRKDGGFLSGWLDCN
jgi:hypothetical protein